MTLRLYDPAIYCCVLTFQSRETTVFLVGEWIGGLRFHKWILKGTGQRAGWIKMKDTELELPYFQFRKKFVAVFVLCTFHLTFCIWVGATRVSNFLFFRILHSLVCPSAYSTKLLFFNHSASVSQNFLELKTYSPNVSARTSPIQRVPFYNLVLLSIANGYRKCFRFFEVFYFCFMP
jgi:hypothetical protein